MNQGIRQVSSTFPGVGRLTNPTSRAADNNDKNKRESGLSRAQFCRLAVLGDSGVGKTALIVQFIRGCFLDDYDPTIENAFNKQCVIDDEIVLVEIIDTSGIEEYAALRPQWIREGEGILLVYSISSRNSFERIEEFRQAIIHAKRQGTFHVIIVANKCDREQDREVGTNEGRDLARQYGYGFLETSAKQRINIDAAFVDLMRETRKYQKLSRPDKQALTRTNEDLPRFRHLKSPVPPGAQPYKLVVVGDGAVGKTPLIIQFVDGYFLDEYDPTIEELYSKQCVVDNEVARVEIIDTAGLEEYAALRQQSMREGEGFLLVYSIASRYSFEKIDRLHREIVHATGRDTFPVVVVANKCDREQDREVGTNEGRDLAKQFGCKFFETSAKERINVDDAFVNLIREVRKYKK